MGGRPEAIRIQLLGGFTVWVGAREMEGSAWRLRKAASLVKVLALSPGHLLHRDQAMYLLWPDLGRRAASNSLRQTLYVARRVLSPEAAMGSHYLRSAGESLVLCPESDLWIDVGVFQETAATARRAGEPAPYRAAIELYAGDLLPEDRYEQWAEEERKGLRTIYLTLLDELAVLYEERGDYGLAADTLRRSLLAEPTNEEAHAGLMRVYALLGRRREALAQYGQLRGLLSRELGAEPDDTTNRLHQEIAAGPSPSPPISAAGPSPMVPATENKHNLPPPRTSFLG